MNDQTPTPDDPFAPPPGAAAERAVPASRKPFLSGARRVVATALLSLGLLTIGGVAVVNAASPSAAAFGSATTPGAASGSTGGSAGGSTTHSCP